MADVVYINVEEGTKRVMNNTKLYAKLLTKFKDDQNIKSIESFLAAGDLPNAQVATHTLKGLSANLSLTELNKQVIELEAQIKSGTVKPDQYGIVKTVYDQTVTEVDKVIAQYA
ncbi:MAG: Hpt domain-containing protein [Spirochaetes bacterium]|nr:Hpt domain-containing protein [Spirochaetota bacterium]